MNVFPPKPLGFVKEGLEKLGHDVSYVYDDLIFPSHTAYLLQFGKENYELTVYMNRDCDTKESDDLKEQLKNVLSGDMGFSLFFNGAFTLEQAEDEELKLRFYTAV